MPGMFGPDYGQISVESVGQNLARVVPEVLRVQSGIGRRTVMFHQGRFDLLSSGLRQVTFIRN